MSENVLRRLINKYTEKGMNKYYKTMTQLSNIERDWIKKDNDR